MTSDIFPTLLDLLQLTSPAPQRPIDGISLRTLLVDGSMTERPLPIGFWRYNSGSERANGRWIDENLARGTTPTTRNPAIDFLNFKHPIAKTSDFGGDAAWTGNRFKLVITESARAGGKRKGAGGPELFDLIADPKEERNLAATHPDIVRRLTAELHEWQRSVERSLSGADYK